MDFTTARGRLRLSPTTATTDLDTMDLATGPTATVMDFTTARGRLRLSPRLILTCSTVATGPTAMATPPTATAMDFTTARGRLRLRLTLTTTVDTTAMDSAMSTATVLATGPTGDKLL